VSDQVVFKPSAVTHDAESDLIGKVTLQHGETVLEVEWQDGNVTIEEPSDLDRHEPAPVNPVFGTVAA